MNKEEMANDFVDIENEDKQNSCKVIVPILYLIIVILVVLLIIGIKNQFGLSELDKFKNYLKKNEGFKCTDNICIESNKVGNIITFTNEINFDTNTLTHTSYGNNGLNTSKTIYDWSTNSATYHSKLIATEINASYNYVTNEFNCSSDSKDNDFVNTECKLGKLAMKEFKDEFEKIIKDSSTKYFEN